MILDLDHFVEREQGFWRELETFLGRIEDQSAPNLALEEALRFHYLFQRASSDLAKIQTFSAEPELRAYLESLVARSYSHVHEERSRRRSTVWRWFSFTFPSAFRRHYKAFWLALFTMLLGSVFAAFAMTIDPDAKETLMPFSHLAGDPSERVRMEEEKKDDKDQLAGRKGQFSAYLMNNNIRVSILAMALGVSYGVGTLVVLFYNGVILGAVFTDYIAAGESVFLFGWLLPHGVIEIPAIFIGSQAGLVLARAMLGWGTNARLRHRLRMVRPDVVTLILGAAALLVWAGMVEAFLSQYHEPVIPYSLKIAFGVVELVLLVLYLMFAGRQSRSRTVEAAEAII